MGGIVPDELAPDSEQAAPPSPPSKKPGLPLWLGIMAGIAAVIFGIVVVIQIATPLAGMIAPADPPFFEPATLLTHENSGTGIDEWLFETGAAGCEVYEWYNERAEFCRLTPGSGCAGTDLFQHDNSYSVAYCQGSVPFGDFAADWEIYIATGYNEEERTRFRLAREVDWINQD